MSALKKLAGQTAIYGLPSIVGRLLNYLLVPLYTNIFLTNEYGVVTELYAYVAFLMVIMTYGMETAFFRFSKKHNGDSSVFSTTMWSLICTSSVFLLIVLLFRHPIANAMDYGSHPEYIVYFGLILAIDAVCTIPFASLRNRQKPLQFAGIKVINIASNIFFNLFFLVFCPWWTGGHPDSILTFIYHPSVGVGYIFISNLLASMMTLAALFPEIFKMQRVFDKKLLHTMLLYAFPIMIWGMAGIVNETFDRILLKHLTPDFMDPMAQLGIYGACYKVSIVMTLFIQAFRFAAEPFFFEHSDHANAKETYAKVMHFFIITCSFIFVVCTVFLNDLMHFVGPAFRVGANVVPPLLMANLFLGIFYNLSVWYKITDQTKFGAYISLFGAALTLVLNFIFVPIFGYTGAAWATFICYFAIALVSYLLGQKYYPIPYAVKSAFYYLAVAVMLYVIHANISTTPMLSRLYGLIAIGVFSYLIWIREPELRKLRIKN